MHLFGLPMCLLSRHRLTPGLGGYAVLIIVGLFAPIVAVVGYLAGAVFFLIPLRIHKRGRPAR